MSLKKQKVIIDRKSGITIHRMWPTVKACGTKGWLRGHITGAFSMPPILCFVFLFCIFAGNCPLTFKHDCLGTDNQGRPSDTGHRLSGSALICVTDCIKKNVLVTQLLAESQKTAIPKFRQLLIHASCEAAYKLCRAPYTTCAT